MKVIIAPAVCGFSLNRDCLEELFARRPELFDEPFPADELRLEGQTDAELLDWHSSAVMRQGHLHFLKEKDPDLRTDAVLLAALEAYGDTALRGKDCSRLKVVEVPDDVRWYVREDDDGSESIHETHRVWQ
jgi:hypothetical protein